MAAKKRGQKIEPAGPTALFRAGRYGGRAKIERLQERIEKLEALLEISRRLMVEENFDRLLSRIMRETTEVMEADRSSLFLVDRDKNELWSKIAQKAEIKEIRQPMGKGISGYVAQTGKTLNIPDAYQDYRFDPTTDMKTGYRTKTVLCMPMLNHRKEIIGVIEVMNKKDGVFTKEDEELLSALASQAAGVVEKAQLYDELKKTFESAISTLADTIDARDRISGKHTKRVSKYSDEIAKELNLPEREREVLKIAALLHDYGKICIRDAILCKPGKFTEREKKIMRKHVYYTKVLLSKMYFSREFKNVPDIASHHHEKLDGSGYPDGLKDDEIPLGAEIMAVADFYDALSQKRHYRNPMPLEQVLGLLEEGKGKYYEPKVVDAFLRYLKRKGYPPYNHKLYASMKMQGEL